MVFFCFNCTHQYALDFSQRTYYSEDNFIYNQTDVIFIRTVKYINRRLKRESAFYVFVITITLFISLAFTLKEPLKRLIGAQILTSIINAPSIEENYAQAFKDFDTLKKALDSMLDERKGIAKKMNDARPYMFTAVPIPEFLAQKEYVEIITPTQAPIKPPPPITNQTTGEGDTSQGRTVVPMTLGTVAANTGASNYEYTF